MKNQKRLGNEGFSLVELIVVIAIMAVLMGVLAPTLIGNIEKSRESTDLQNLDTIRGGVVTALANEAAYKEVMASATATAPVVLDLGAAGSAKVDGMKDTANKAYTNFEAELESIVSGSIAMKSSASGNNHVYVVIQQNGSVTALIATSAANAQALTAVNCTKTKDDTGNAKALLSGAGATGASS
ncbi:MAG: prepilin-type N-terminal cleavage/methylation domain-containing protein [Lachnospira sp.]|nr:prepilin-type N-terminal cleavage/methylation domain-containing protein [Lachnospira sp.]